MGDSWYKSLLSRKSQFFHQNDRFFGNFAKITFLSKPFILVRTGSEKPINSPRSCFLKPDLARGGRPPTRQLHFLDPLKKVVLEGSKMTRVLVHILLSLGRHNSRLRTYVLNRDPGLKIFDFLLKIWASFWTCQKSPDFSLFQNLRPRFPKSALFSGFFSVLLNFGVFVNI